MSNKFFAAFSMLMAGFFSVSAQRSIGNDAPTLYIIKWLKGKPVPSFEQGKVYLVEFGYVACPPCRAAIPHLTAVARKYRKDEKVEVVSIFTAESDTKNPGDLSYIKRIEDLTRFMGDKMDYAIAVDVPMQKTREAWGLQSTGFPAFFIINQEGKIAYNQTGSDVEMDFALDAIVNTGRYDARLFEKSEQKKEIDSFYTAWDKFDEQQQRLKQKGDYAEMIRNIDSALTTASIEKKNELLFDKFKTYLESKDSVAADNCLGEIIATRQGNWPQLNTQFQFLLPPSVNQVLPFNYERYLIIADRAVEELGTPFLKAEHLNIKANVIYGYKHNKEDAVTVLNKALKLVKDTHVAKDIKRVQEDIQQLEVKDERRKAADKDWQQLQHHLNEQSGEANKILLSKGNVPYQQYIAQHKRKQAEMAELFWRTYTEDERRIDAMFIFLQTNLTMVPWMSDITTDLADRLKEKEEKLREDYIKYSERQLAVGPGYFRSFPRDLKAEEQWEKTGNEMIEWAKQRATLQEKEAFDWDLFSRDWRTAAFTWVNMPYRDEKPVDEINALESDFWKGAAAQYWKQFWIRFNQHVVKYPSFPILVERAGDFISGTKSLAPELGKSYWQQIVDDYGNVQHPLAGEAGVQALYKRALDQLHISKIELKEAPVDMKFTSLDGREIDLANYRGKVVLIDFWASWCKPCVGEMPALKGIYDKYHDKGFEMIGICMDDEARRDEVKKLLAKNSLIGPQRFEGKGFDGDYYKQLYGIFGLPTIWLLDKEGKLVSTNARGEALEPLLRKCLE
jgi:thiol-disulfide isomerase/thioredoxin